MAGLSPLKNCGGKIELSCLVSGSTEVLRSQSDQAALVRKNGRSRIRSPPVRSSHLLETHASRDLQSICSLGCRHLLCSRGNPLPVGSLSHAESLVAAEALSRAESLSGAKALRDADVLSTKTLLRRDALPCLALPSTPHSSHRLHPGLLATHSILAATHGVHLIGLATHVLHVPTRCFLFCVLVF